MKSCSTTEQQAAWNDRATELLDEVRRYHADAEVMRLNLTSTTGRAMAKLDVLATELKQLAETRGPSAAAVDLQDIRGRLEVSMRQLEMLGARMNSDASTLLRTAQRLAVLLVALSMAASIGVVAWFARVHAEAAALGEQVAVMQAKVSQLESRGANLAFRECTDSAGRTRLCVRADLHARTAEDGYVVVDPHTR